MYKIEDLFDKRSVVGCRLEQLLKEKGRTKVELCKSIGMSRPTFDKLMAGTLTSKTNYEKHIEKVLKYLDVTPDYLLSNIADIHRRIRQIRKLMRIATKDISRITGISLDRLKEIEGGGEASIAELRDIALCLNVSVAALSGGNIFETQIATLDYFVSFNKTDETADLSGFWGHVGILLSNTDEYMWYPITAVVRNELYKVMDNEYIVIPCMNNKLLFLYMPNIKEIVFLDEACDAPGFANWNPNVSEGEIPLVVYDVLDEYLWGNFDENDEDDERLSSRFKAFLKKFIAEKEWSDDDIFDMLNTSTIYYADGKNRWANIIFGQDESISMAVYEAYEFQNIEESENMLFFTDSDGIETILNKRNISMLEIPLLKIEKAVEEMHKELWTIQNR